MVTLHMHFDSKRDVNRKTRVGCRCILIRDGKILMSHETETGKWMIPGGGLEDKETLEQCCAREMVEETGMIVSPKEQFLTIAEYFDVMNYTNHYYFCDYVRETERTPTENEISKGMVPKWIDLDEMISIFAKYKDYEESDPMLFGLYRREHTALSYFKTQLKNTY